MKREHLYKLRDMIRKAAVSLTDADALTAIEMFAPWAAGAAYDVDERLRYGGRLYRVMQAHTSQSDWTPDRTPALYAEVASEDDAGTRDKPIPYSGNMALERGKYYVQDGVVYRCTRDTVNPVYDPLEALVGLYVEIAA